MDKEGDGCDSENGFLTITTIIITHLVHIATPKDPFMVSSAVLEEQIGIAPK